MHFYDHGRGRNTETEACQPEARGRQVRRVGTVPLAGRANGRGGSTRPGELEGFTPTGDPTAAAVCRLRLCCSGSKGCGSFPNDLQERKGTGVYLKKAY